MNFSPETPDLSESEFAENTVVLKPTVDFLIHPSSEGSPLPPEIINNPSLQEQARQRRELSQLLGSIYAQVPDATMEISTALEQRFIEEEKIVELYDKLGQFLNSDENNARLILYLPFELLPDRKSKEKSSERLAHSQEGFVTTYLENWRKLLEEDDVRANFVNGDILEPGLSDGPPLRYRQVVPIGARPNLQDPRAPCRSLTGALFLYKKRHEIFRAVFCATSASWARASSAISWAFSEVRPV